MNTFRTGYFLGHLIWIRSGDASETSRILRGMLASCHIADSGVWSLSPRQLIDLMSFSLDQIALLKSEVILVRNFERLTGFTAEAFLRAISRLRAAHAGIGLRLILISECEITDELQKIHRLQPCIVPVGGGVPPCEEINSRVHGLIDEASRITEVPIKRISEKAAQFLEESCETRKGSEVLELLVDGIRRSNGHTLRFRDLLPNFARFFDPEDSAETCCN